MAKGIDVINEIKWSAELIHKNYKQVAIPLIILFLFSAGGGAGAQFPSGFRDGSDYDFSDLSSSFFELSALIIVLVVFFVVALLFLSLLNESIWMYVYNFFYSLIYKNKITESWQGQIKRFAFKSFILMLLWLFIFVLAYSIPLLQIFWVISSANFGLQQIISEILKILFWLAISTLLFFLALFFLSPLWVYYAIEGKPLLQSIKKSVSLVARNLATFFVLSAVFFLLFIGSIIVSIVSALCCLAWLVSPITSVYLTLLYGVSLIKIKKEIETSSG
ncbi:MAG: hypothetical protein QW275_00765 [Candidatus Anstonellaceae archaeon]